MLRSPTQAALRPCATPGCPGLTRDGRYCERCTEPSERPLAACERRGCPRTTRERWCPAHAAEEAARRRGARAQDTRPNAARRGYGRAWRKLRAEVLRARPWCEACRMRRASDVDHLIPRRLGGRDVASNLRPLCHGCHSRKTARQDGGFGRGVRAPHSPGGGGGSKSLGGG